MAYIKSPLGDMGDDLGKLLAAILFGHDYRAAAQAKDELAPIIQKQELTGDTKASEAYLNAQKPKQAQRIAKSYTKQTGETVPHAEFKLNVPMPGQPAGMPIDIPAQAPGWPTTEAGRQIRTQSERAKGTPTEKLPLYAQEDTQMRKQELASNPFKIMSSLDPAFQGAAAKALEMSFTPEFRQQYPAYSEAATHFRMFDMTTDEMMQMAVTGQPPKRALKERPQQYKPLSFDPGTHIDRYADLYSYGVVTKKITQQQYNDGLLKMLKSQGTAWPDPTKDFPPFLRPGADPDNTQDRQIANQIGELQEEVRRIRTTGTDQEKDDLARRWQASIALDEGRKVARFDIVTNARLGKTKEAKEALFKLAESYGLTPIEKKNWVTETLKGIQQFLSGPRDKQPSDPQVFGYLDRLTQGLYQKSATLGTTPLSPGKLPTGVSGTPPTATTWVDEKFKKK